MDSEPKTTVEPETIKQSERWADICDEEDDAVFQETVDADGVKTTVSYDTNAEGKYVKITRRTKDIVTVHRTNKRVLDRSENKNNGWGPESTDDGEGAKVMQSNEDIFIELPRGPRFDDDLDSIYVASDMAATQRRNELRNKFRVLTDIVEEEAAPPTTTKERIEPSADELPWKNDEPKPEPTSSSKSNVYVAPAMRFKRNGGGQVRDRDELPTVRVTNLSDEATEADLQRLFSVAGKVQRVHIAKNKMTNRPIGFGFVSFYNEADASRAIELLHRHAFDNMVMNVERARSGAQYASRARGQ